MTAHLTAVQNVVCQPPLNLRKERRKKENRNRTWTEAEDVFTNTGVCTSMVIEKWPHLSTENTLVFVLVCSLVCSGATHQDETNGVSRTYVTEGEDAVLHCSYGGSLENTVVDWENQNKKEVCLYDGGQHCEDRRDNQDEQYKGRASLFYDELKNGNASLILNNTRIEDKGTYTCTLPRLSSGIQRSTVELIVSVSRTYVKEGEDAVLHCSSVESLKNMVVDWKNQNKEVFLYDRGWHYENRLCCQDEQYKGRVSLFYDELKNRNASLILNDTRIEDTGIYTCDLSSGRQIFTMELIVERVLRNRIGLEKGAVQAPDLKIVNVSEAGVELQCVVRGSSSKPSVEWQTCEGTSLNSEEPLVSETRGRYDTTLLVTVTETKTNCFRCVVKQEDIYHRIDTNITVSDKLGTVVHLASWVSGVVTVTVVLLLALVLYLIIKKRISRRNMSRETEEMMKNFNTSEQNTHYERIDTKDMMNGSVKEEETRQNNGSDEGDEDIVLES
ncbi:butyrophilin subfamily 3 member A2-like isoform X2 [Solea solea]|uniref:butyrophilin subfamily 3 member A2-like isoform X2 n=1 Tax=Solea solea TaxID=90069 RepID=UPI00272D7270|nr:butyrophilin subfamily 3 member A2-like isoform X2 [Solea solea]